MARKMREQLEDLNTFMDYNLGKIAILLSSENFWGKNIKNVYYVIHKDSLQLQL